MSNISGRERDRVPEGAAGGRARGAPVPVRGGAAGAADPAAAAATAASGRRAGHTGQLTTPTAATTAAAAATAATAARTARTAGTMIQRDTHSFGHNFIDRAGKNP